MTENILPIIAVALLVQLGLLYVVIKMAVNDALYKALNKITALLEKIASK